MTLQMKKARIIEQIDYIDNEQLLDTLANILTNELLQSNIMQYVSPMKKKTNLDELLESYQPPDLSKVVGIFPNDQPLEEVLKMLD